MKRSQLAFAAVVVGLAACSEAATAPESAAFDPVLRAAGVSFSNPPPPPIDTGAGLSITLEIATNRMTDPFAFGSSLPSQGKPDSEVGQGPGTDRLAVRSSVGIGGADPLGPAAVIHTTSVVYLPFALHVTYNRDEHAPTGYLQFFADPSHHVTVDPHSEIVQDPHGTGHFVGSGMIHIPTPIGVVDIHLATVIDSGTVFEGCGPNLVNLHPEACFGIHLNTAAIGHYRLGQVTIFPACYPKPENHYCVVSTTNH